MLTEAFYHVWQFLCDMPRRGTPDPAYGAVRKSWLTAIEPLFRRGSEGAVRSCEMIVRRWPRLEQDYDEECTRPDCTVRGCT